MAVDTHSQVRGVDLNFGNVNQYHLPLVGGQTRT